MKPRTNSSESGQAILLIVLAIVALLGFTALAVDGSMIYSDRRLAQSAADSASLAGGSQAAETLESMDLDYWDFTSTGTTCTGDWATVADAAREGAVRRAKDNNFTIDSNYSDGMGVQATCGVTDVFATRKSNGQRVKVFSDKYMDIETRVTQQTETAFAQYLYSGDLVNTASAVTRVYPRRSMAYGFAIISLNDEPCSGNKNGVQFRGSSTVKVTLGGVWSNGCMDVDGSLDVDKTPIVWNYGGKIFYFDSPLTEAQLGAKIKRTNTSAMPTQLKDDSDRIPPELYDLPTPNCAGHHISADDLVNYYSAHKGPLPAGLYCVDGDIKVTNNKDRIEGVGVTLYVTGDLDLSGGTVILKAPPANYVGDAIPSVVIYAPKSNMSKWKINGNDNFFLVGSVVAPGVSMDLVGSSLANAYQSQIIVNNIDIGGNNDTAVYYCNCSNGLLPTKIDMQR